MVALDQHHVVVAIDVAANRQRFVLHGLSIVELTALLQDAADVTQGIRYRLIVIVVDRSIGDRFPLLDIGAVMQSICLAALSRGLGTCIEDQGVMYPQVLRELAGIPESKRIVIAIAIGYPDWDFPANSVETAREPLDGITTWRGFE